MRQNFEFSLDHSNNFYFKLNEEDYQILHLHIFVNECGKIDFDLIKRHNEKLYESFKLCTETNIINIINDKTPLLHKFIKYLNQRYGFAYLIDQKCNTFSHYGAVTSIPKQLKLKFEFMGYSFEDYFYSIYEAQNAFIYICLKIIDKLEEQY